MINSVLVGRKGKRMPKEETNEKFSKTNEEFKKACEEANIKPTKRQASKWRDEKGLAWKKKYSSK